MSDHAKLSASESARWLNCAGSIKAIEQLDIKDTGSIFAAEGTAAHSLAEICLTTKYDTSELEDSKIGGIVIDAEMIDNVQDYIDYIHALYDEDKDVLLVEELVQFTDYVPDGFGTADAIIIKPDTATCHIVDLKYGKGVKVEAEGNTQAQMYALGVMQELRALYDIRTFVMHIVQPRISNYSEWTISQQDLREFGEYVKKRAELALSPNAPRNAGEKQCQWCPAKGDCATLAAHTANIIGAEFDDLDNLDVNILTDEHKATILKNKKLVINFLSAVEDSVFDQLARGEEFEGYKLVEGRSIRKWKPEAEEVLVDKLGDDAYNKKLIGLTEAKKVLSKDEIDALTIKPEGKPTLAPETDKRPSIGDNIIATFDNLD